MALSDGLRMELMLELSGLSRQEVLVVKACAATKDFEGVAKVLVDQYSGIHLREGSKSWNGRSSTPQSYGKFGKGYGGSKGPQGGKGSYKTAYNAYPDEEGYCEYDEYQEEYYEEDAPYVGLLGGIEEHPEQPIPHVDNSPEAFDFHDEIDEYEATALNALMDLGEGETEDDKGIGEAIHVAFGRVKGKGKGKPKGKGNAFIRSNLSIEQRRKRLSEIKAKPTCLRCGAYTGTGQVTLSVNSQVPREMPMQRILIPHRILLSRQHTLQIFRIHLQMMEFS